MQEKLTPESDFKNQNKSLTSGQAEKGNSRQKDQNVQ